MTVDMSGFNPRGAPRVSQHLSGLNYIPNPQDLQQQDEFAALDNLEILTNTDFFDFDQFNGTFDQQQAPSSAEQSATKNGPPFDFTEFAAFAPAATSSPTALQGQYPPQPQHFGGAPNTGDKRKASVAMTSPGDLEEVSRLAAEEDKRRRNTAASARFRVKKKQREQALEKQAKDMTDKVQQLEGKVQQLEMENKWLKELITEKSDVKTLDTALMLKRRRHSEERSNENRTDGVGTASLGETSEA